MDMDKLLEAIQILIKEELKEQLPALIKEGVKAEMKKILSETKVAQKPQSKGISMAKAILEEEPIQESVVPTKQYSKNPIINQILNETRGGIPQCDGGFRTMNFGQGDMGSIVGKNAMAEKEEEYGPDDVPWDTEEKAKPAKEVEKEKPKEEKAVELAEPSKEAKDSKPKPAKKVKEESESKTTPAQSKKAVKTIKSNFDKVIENASKIEGIATGEFLSENSDVAILMDLLGITATEGKYKKTPSEASIAASQKEVFGIYEKVASGAISIEEAKPLLVKELSWMRSTDQAGDSTARQDRAKRGAARYGEGNPDAHLVLQLVEELGEMAAESTVSENPSKPLEVLKRALKILRFGASTVIKQEGIYKGQTNYEALTSALTTKEVEPVIDVKLENNTSEESLGARFLKGLKKNRTYEEFVAYMETLTDAQKKTRKADPKYYYEISKNWVKDHFKAKRVKEGSVFHTTLDVFNAISDATGTKIDPNSEVLVNKLGDNIKQEYIDYLIENEMVFDQQFLFDFLDDSL